MSIFPLPVFEADADPRRRAAMSDEEVYARLEAPKSIVVRFGAMKLIGEYPYDGEAKPGCGSKLVVRTHRGTELAEMLTTTCSNSGCAKSVSRQEMLEYIENSGGRDYPFHTEGRVVRVASIEDLNRWSQMRGEFQGRVKVVKQLVAQSGLPMKVVDIEPILGGELLTVYYLSEDRVDFRELVRELAAEFQTRIDMRQVGARDEARLVADYERCGQHCCCKNFLKVLKPVSMKSAKVQKATLDPLKISGRCGRLMCCLRYEDQTYTELAKRLPKLRSRVGTSEGPGTVIETKILVQLALVRLDHNGQEIAIPVEELMSPDDCPQPRAPGEAAPEEAARRGSDPFRGMKPEQVIKRAGDGARQRRQDAHRAESVKREEPVASEGPSVEPPQPAEAPGSGQSRRRRRRRKRDADGPREAMPNEAAPHRNNASQPPRGEDGPPSGDAASAADPSAGRKRRRRRGRRGRGRSEPDAGEGQSS
jgi:cell fate regulator YaaT (PSP1 superfamily)